MQKICILLKSWKKFWETAFYLFFFFVFSSKEFFLRIKTFSISNPHTLSKRFFRLKEGKIPLRKTVELCTPFTTGFQKLNLQMIFLAVSFLKIQKKIIKEIFRPIVLIGSVLCNDRSLWRVKTLNLFSLLKRTFSGCMISYLLK